MTEFISRNYGKEGYEIIIKTDSYEHYRAAEDFARRLIEHSKPKTNADIIRSMSDQGLAMCLYEIGYVGGWYSKKDALVWLQQPAEEADNETVGERKDGDGNG